mmetsp:Transcript_136604/g.436990  ORF Transcript_136604/g.436990 Transcript_136604/m.436990 type:complete len:250 (+) Transcript_136604:878-1627(+)
MPSHLRPRLRSRTPSTCPPISSRRSSACLGLKLWPRGRCSMPWMVVLTSKLMPMLWPLLGPRLRTRTKWSNSVADSIAASSRLRVSNRCTFSTASSCPCAPSSRGQRQSSTTSLCSGTQSHYLGQTSAARCWVRQILQMHLQTPCAGRSVRSGRSSGSRWRRTSAITACMLRHRPSKASQSATIGWASPSTTMSLASRCSPPAYLSLWSRPGLWTHRLPSKTASRALSSTSSRTWTQEHAWTCSSPSLR